jgi:CHAD domain-containing protein
MRRMEAILRALAFNSLKNERRLLQAVRPVRKKAGKVRDMDILMGLASQPHLNGEKGCSVRLLQHLGGRREKNARKLQKVAASHMAEISKRLKRCGRFLDKAIQSGKKPADGSKNSSGDAAALALHLEAELRNWPTLNRRNLHPFRLKVKELRYVLELSMDKDSKFMAALAEVKDTIGEWHDWEELARVAKEQVQHTGCKLSKRIRCTAHDRCERALLVANRMRKQNLGTSTMHRRGRAASQSFSRAAQPALRAASALAA